MKKGSICESYFDLLQQVCRGFFWQICLKRSEWSRVLRRRGVRFRWGVAVCGAVLLFRRIFFLRKGMVPAVETPASQIPVVKLTRSTPKVPTWVLWKEVEKPADRIPPGSPVDVVDARNRWVGRAFYNGHARVRLRMLSRNPNELIDAAWLRRRLERAIQFRTQTLQLLNSTTGCRLVHSEGDGLSGLIVDKYADLFVIEYFSAGMFRFRKEIKTILSEFFPGARFYSFAQSHIQKQESFDLYEEPTPEPVSIVENGLTFRVSPGTKHKTGFFLDQRENRKALAELAVGKRVLDLCCHTGGFSLYAAKANAAAVTGVDLDPLAIEAAQANAVANGLNIDFQAANLFDWLEQRRATAQTFDLVILDPAKQTRSAEKIPDALRAYYAMNRMALDAVAPNGLFVTCSCSGLIREDAFLQTITDAAAKAGRELQVFRVTGASTDHPFSTDAPESRYLKAFWCYVR